METFVSRAAASNNRRKSRPSKARGLRTSTGCLTCRKRRVKCDEGKPKCARCSKTQRQCSYGEYSSQLPSDDHLSSSNGSNSPNGDSENVPDSSYPNQVNDHVAMPGADTFGNVVSTSPMFVQRPAVRSTGESDALNGSGFVGSVCGAAVSDPLEASNDVFVNENHSLGTHQSAQRGLSPVAQASQASFSPSAAPFEWYELLAQDALGNIDDHAFLSNESHGDFDPSTLLNRPSHGFSLLSQSLIEFGPNKSGPNLSDNDWQEKDSASRTAQNPDPWNTPERLILEPEEVVFFRHFVVYVGPFFDLFDPAKHFSNIVPQLALRNIGLMKSMLAVGARHLSLEMQGSSDEVLVENQTPSSLLSHHARSEKHLAVQYYYETLGYLSQAMQYPSYTRSSEILATAIMISTYEMMDDGSNDWERHLKGAYWIQRSQDNDGESRGMREAVWWAWLRQDIWAAFRHKRRTMTIWHPKKDLQSLSNDELACRSLYLLAKVVQYVADEQKQTQNLVQRIEEGDRLLLALNEWHSALPAAFSPVPMSKQDSQSIFEPIWIHPPAYSAAVQTYYCAKIIILLNKPSSGGIDEYHERQKTIEQAVNTICGLAQYPSHDKFPLAFVSVQCLYAAGQGITDSDKQTALIRILEETLKHCKWLKGTLIDDLRTTWSSK